jgi:hypothetical protein
MVNFINLSNHELIVLAGDHPTQEFTAPNGRTQKALDGAAQVVLQLPAYKESLPSVTYTPCTVEVLGGVSISFEGSKVLKDLPPSIEGTIYITSRQTAEVAWSQGRKDIMTPGQLVFKEPHSGRGEIAGCLGLMGSK